MEELKYKNTGNDSKLKTKDLITLGLYTLLLILLMAVGVGVCAGVFSVLFAGKVYFSIFTPVATAVFAAPAFTLIFNKIKKNYSVFIFRTYCNSLSYRSNRRNFGRNIL